MHLPALLDRLHPEHEQPGHDDEHAHADDQLDEEAGDGDPIAGPLSFDHSWPDTRNDPAQHDRHQCDVRLERHVVWKMSCLQQE